MAIGIKSINSDLTQQIFRAKATHQRIAATIKSVLPIIKKVLSPLVRGKRLNMNWRQ